MLEPVSRQVLVRVVADVVLVNWALLVALILRYLWLVGMDATSPPRTTFTTYAHAYGVGTVVLTLLAIPVFWGSGFYTHGRAYQGKYKALTVAQAITLCYLMFGFAAYFLGALLPVPRATFPIAWLLTLVLVVGARLWSSIWAAVLRTEQRLSAPPPERPVQRVLVIGGDGYIGSALLPKLLAEGYHVRVLSLLLYGIESIEDLLRFPNLEIVKADFRQVDKVVKAMADVDAVVHLGAIVGDPACALDEDLTIDVNLTATRMIGEVAKGHGVNRFIFASTCSVYGASDEILDERSALNPVSLYARSKIACERVLMSLANDGFAPVCLRFGTVYGLSGRTRFDLVVNLLSAKAVIDGEITVTGADQWRPFVHVDDAALAVLKALQAPLSLVRNEVFNVGSDAQNRTIGQVGQLIHEMVPTAKVIDLNWNTERRNYRVSFAKVRNKLNFTPQWTLEQGIEQVIAAIECGEVADYRDAKYSNAKFLGEEGIPLLPRSNTNWARDLLNEALPA